MKNEKLKMKNDDIGKLLKRRLPKNIFCIVRKIGTAAEDNGSSAFLVGGFVRDLLLGLGNLDLDIAVETDAARLVNLLQKKIKFKATTHQRFGTARLILPGGLKIDLASARQEQYAHPAALPAVSLSSIRADLGRRDFTINALALNIATSNFGEILDFFEGRSDLTRRKIRVLHQRSFIDDPTRILRAIRFEQRYNFRLEENTAQLLKQAVAQGMLGKLSAFRVGDELILLLKENYPLKNLRRLAEFTPLSFIHSQIKLDPTMTKHFKLAEKKITWFKKSFPGQDLAAWMVYFIFLTRRLKLPQLNQLCRDYSFNKQALAKLNFFKKNSKSALKVISSPSKLSTHELYQQLRSFSNEGLLALLCLAPASLAQKRIKLFLKKLSKIRLMIRGEHLKRLGLKPGPRYRQVLRQLLLAKIEGRIASFTDELRLARRLVKN